MVTLPFDEMVLGLILGSVMGLFSCDEIFHDKYELVVSESFLLAKSRVVFGGGSCIICGPWNFSNPLKPQYVV